MVLRAQIAAKTDPAKPSFPAVAALGVCIYRDWTALTPTLSPGERATICTRSAGAKRLDVLSRWSVFERGQVNSLSPGAPGERVRVRAVQFARSATFERASSVPVCIDRLERGFLRCGALVQARSSIG